MEIAADTELSTAVADSLLRPVALGHLSSKTNLQLTEEIHGAFIGRMWYEDETLHCQLHKRGTFTSFPALRAEILQRFPNTPPLLRVAAPQTATASSFHSSGTAGPNGPLKRAPLLRKQQPAASTLPPPTSAAAASAPTAANPFLQQHKVGSTSSTRALRMPMPQPPGSGLPPVPAGAAASRRPQPGLSDINALSRSKLGLSPPAASALLHSSAAYNNGCARTTTDVFSRGRDNVPPQHPARPLSFRPGVTQNAYTRAEIGTAQQAGDLPAGPAAAHASIVDKQKLNALGEPMALPEATDHGPRTQAAPAAPVLPSPAAAQGSRCCLVSDRHTDQPQCAPAQPEVAAAAPQRSASPQLSSTATAPAATTAAAAGDHNHTVSSLICSNTSAAPVTSTGLRSYTDDPEFRVFTAEWLRPMTAAQGTMQDCLAAPQLPRYTAPLWLQGPEAVPAVGNHTSSTAAAAAATSDPVVVLAAVLPLSENNAVTDGAIATAPATAAAPVYLNGSGGSQSAGSTLLQVAAWPLSLLRKRRRSGSAVDQGLASTPGGDNATVSLGQGCLEGLPESKRLAAAATAADTRVAVATDGPQPLQDSMNPPLLLFASAPMLPGPFTAAAAHSARQNFAAELQSQQRPFGALLAASAPHVAHAPVAEAIRLLYGARLPPGWLHCVAYLPVAATVLQCQHAYVYLLGWHIYLQVSQHPQHLQLPALRGMSQGAAVAVLITVSCWLASKVAAAAGSQAALSAAAVSEGLASALAAMAASSAATGMGGGSNSSGSNGSDGSSSGGSGGGGGGGGTTNGSHGSNGAAGGGGQQPVTALLLVLLENVVLHLCGGHVVGGFYGFLQLLLHANGSTAAVAALPSAAPGVAAQAD